MVSAVHHPDTVLDMGFDLECRCVRCRCTRDVPRGAGCIMEEVGALTWIVNLPEPCDQCGEHRVKVTFDLGL